MGIRFTVEAIQVDGVVYERALVVALAIGMRSMRREVLRQLAFHLSTLGLATRPWLARLFVRAPKAVAPVGLPLVALTNAVVHSPQIRDEVVGRLLEIGYLAPLQRSWVSRLFSRAHALPAA